MGTRGTSSDDAAPSSPGSAARARPRTAHPDGLPPRSRGVRAAVALTRLAVLVTALAVGASLLLGLDVTGASERATSAGTGPATTGPATAGPATTGPADAAPRRADEASRSLTRQESPEPTASDEGTQPAETEEPSDLEREGAGTDETGLDEPLQLALTEVTPTAISNSALGEIVVRGRVTNTTDDEWRDVRLYPLTSLEPFTTQAELEDAVDTDPSLPIGDRLTAEGQFDDSITSLAAGETRPFTITLDRDDLRITGASGVYWLGVHAIGETDDIARGNANGRVRTFLPLVPAGERTPDQVRTSVLVPLRAPVRYAGDGTLADKWEWARMLREGGRLDALRRVATGTEVTWVVDPAVLDAVERLANGNPARSLGPTSTPTEPSPDPDATDGEGQGGTDGDDAETDAPGDEGEPGEEPSTPSAPREGSVAASAADWLADMRPRLAAAEVLALPYGDIDLAALADAPDGAERYETARRMSDASLERHDLDASPSVAPIDDWIDADVLAPVEPEATVLAPSAVLADDAVAGLRDAPTVADLDAPGSPLEGRSVVLTDDGVLQGRPGPGEAHSLVQVRQRITSEAALSAINGEPGTSVVASLPLEWNPGADVALDTGLTGDLSTPWLQLAPLGQTLAGGASPRIEAAPDDLRPRPEPDAGDDPRRVPIAGAVLADADALLSRGELLDDVLPATDALVPQVRREAAVLPSYLHRGDSLGMRAAAARGRGDLSASLGEITVELPSDVTLSSESGRFLATVENGLAEPVEVRVVDMGGSPVAIDDTDVVEVAAESRTSVMLTVRAGSTLGVHRLEVGVASPSGALLGATDSRPIRSAAVSDIIWLVIAAAIGLLFIAIAVRLVRRFRSRGGAAA